MILIKCSITFVIYDRKIFINGQQDKQDNTNNAYMGISGKTQIGTWWNGKNGKTTNLEIDTLYIINKAIEYPAKNEQLCLAKALNYDMP